MLILPVSYCFGASVMHTHLYQGGGVVFDRRFMFPDKVLQSIAQIWLHHIRRRAQRHITCSCADRIFGASPWPALRRFLQAGGALAPQRISRDAGGFPDDHSSM